MADIELVIKIPEEIYKHIRSMQFYIPGSRSGKSLLEKILKAIRIGKPLPKGHGDLVDISPYKGKVICSHLYSGVKKLIGIDSIEPIISADKEEKDENS